MTRHPGPFEIDRDVKSEEALAFRHDIMAVSSPPAGATALEALQDRSASEHTTQGAAAPLRRCPWPRSRDLKSGGAGFARCF